MLPSRARHGARGMALRRGPRVQGEPGRLRTTRATGGLRARQRCRRSQARPCGLRRVGWTAPACARPRHGCVKQPAAGSPMLDRRVLARMNPAVQRTAPATRGACRPGSDCSLRACASCDDARAACDRCQAIRRRQVSARRSMARVRRDAYHTPLATCGSPARGIATRMGQSAITRDRDAGVSCGFADARRAGPMLLRPAALPSHRRGAVPAPPDRARDMPSTRQRPVSSVPPGVSRRACRGRASGALARSMRATRVRPARRHHVRRC